MVVLGYTGLRGGGCLGFGRCCGELCPGAGVPLRPDGVLLPLQELAEKKEEPNIACGKTFKGKRERGEERRKSGQQVEAKEGRSGQQDHPVTGLWSRKGVTRTFGALAGFVPWPALCRVISL